MQQILVVDNYDSFTYNLVHLLGQLGVPLTVKRNDEIDVASAASFSHILISPGPGLPTNSGLTMELLNRWQSEKSILGVCLGMQALLVQDGLAMLNMPQVEHGAISKIRLQKDSGTLFAGMPSEFNVGRYHSWAFAPIKDESNYRVTSLSEDGYVMSIQHKNLPVYGVQFHPESVMSEHGLALMENWINPH